MEDVATEAIDEVKITEAGNRVVEDKMSWQKMLKALLRLFNAKAALEAELEVKRSLFVGMDSQMAKEMDIVRKKYESFNQRKKLSIELEIKFQKVVQKGREKMAQNKFSFDTIARTAVRTQKVCGYGG